MDITSLLSRLEEATCGSDQLDREIAEVLGWTRRAATHEECGYYLEWVSPTGEGWGLTASACCPLGRLTQSIDSALTLVPEGWYVDRLGVDMLNPQVWSCVLGSESTGVEIGRGHMTLRPALALCIASLRARQALTQEGSR